MPCNACRPCNRATSALGISPPAITYADLRAAGQAAAGSGKPYAVLSQARLCGRHRLTTHEARFAFWARVRYTLAAPRRHPGPLARLGVLLPGRVGAGVPAGCANLSARHSLQIPGPCTHQHSSRAVQDATRPEYEAAPSAVRVSSAPQGASRLV